MAESFIQQLLDNLVTKLNSPAEGKFFLPAFLQLNGYDPYLGPDSKGFDWQVNITEPQFLVTVGKLCQDIWNAGSICQGDNQIAIADPEIPPLLQLSGCALEGISNVYLASAVATGSDTNPEIAMGFNFQYYSTRPDNSFLAANWLTKARLRGSFTLTQYCCCTTMKPSSTTCQVGTSGPQVGKGTFVTTINQPGSASAWVKITQLAPGVLTIAPNPVGSNPTPPPANIAILFNVPNAPDGAPDVTTEIQITSLPPGTNTESYNQMAEEAFSSPAARINILSQINATMNGNDELNTIGQLITKSVDDYLTANNKYPFDPPAYSIF